MPFTPEKRAGTINGIIFVAIFAAAATMISDLDFIKSLGISPLVVGIVIGTLIAGVWPNAPLHASATDRYDTFAVATGMVDDGVEAVYFLDFVTGNLRAAVLSRQAPYKFNMFYERNILQDMKVTSKDARYLLVTGMCDFRRVGGRGRMSRSAVYVVEVTSGQIAAYAIPWDQQQYATGRTVNGGLVPLDSIQTRNVAVRQ